MSNPHTADGLPDWIAASRTAVVIVDMQRDFASPEGALGELGVDLRAVPAALAAAERVVDEARRADVSVIFVGSQTSPANDSGVWAEWMRRRDADPDLGLALCRAGTPGAAFVGPLPRGGERVIGKTRYSGFFQTNLDTELRRRGVDTIVLCGLTTECCVDATARDAFQLDYHVFVVTDACAAYEADLHAGALKSLDLNCAILVDAAHVIAAWAT